MDSFTCYILSWNVAGLKTSLSHIECNTKGGFEAWLQSVNADILCLQEVKISRKEVADRPRKVGASVAGYDSFWSINEGKGAQKAGLNGVTTLVRKGLTVSACCTSLEDPELDGEGRCVMTDHGSFVVFNTYVPNSGPQGCRVPFKQRWLSALHRAMQRQRAKGKAVIWAGDLNMKLRATDCCWQSRQIRVPKFLAAVSLLAAQQQQEHTTGNTNTVETISDEKSPANGSGNGEGGGGDDPKEALLHVLPLGVLEFARRLGQGGEWQRAKRCLLAKEHKQLSYKNAHGQMVPKWRVVCGTAATTAADGNGDKNDKGNGEGGGLGKQQQQQQVVVYLGKPMWTEAEAKASYSVLSRGVTEEGHIVFGSEDGGNCKDHQSPASSSAVVVRGEAAPAYELSPADCLCLDDLCEVLEKVCGWLVPAHTQRRVGELLDSKAFYWAAKAVSATAEAAAAKTPSSAESSAKLAAEDTKVAPDLSSSSSSLATGMISLHSFIHGFDRQRNAAATAGSGNATVASTPDGGGHEEGTSTPSWDSPMVDAFSHFHPHAKGRATCWNQQLNCRYGNLGGRIGIRKRKEKKG
mmetsp:Transcript_6306/g.13039  ORF Transcript_6306/g.13039 Transcript_6306/m.13039 type:complete len:579 (+) Transcript_6306:114-1850(+)